MKRTTGIRLCALLAALGGLWVGFTQQPPQPLTVEKIADDLHMIVGSGGNVAVLTTNEGVILVDDKFERNVPEILEKVKSITSQPVRYVLNTHQHGDHTGGNAKLMQGSADIIAHENARANMMAGNMPGPPRITFNDKTSVYLGGKEVRANYFGRGHTNGDAVILFPAQRVVHMGDLFVSGAPFIDYSAKGSGVEWSHTIDAALKLDFDRVIPGHGPLMTKADLVAWNESFMKVRQRLSQLKHEGKSKEEVAKLLKMDDLANFGPSQFWNQRSMPGLYDEIK